MTGASPEREIRVASLYPDVMNLYADRGNLIALIARCEARGVRCEVTAVGLGDATPADTDLVLIGGGQDSEQRRIASDLAARGPALRDQAEHGVAMLAVCGGFQLFGHWYRTASGEQLPGAGVFDAVTVAGAPGRARCIGDVLAAAQPEGVGELVGFENHGGRTYLGPAARPFARVLHGHGNNGDDTTEGALFHRAVGTYLHGPLLPKNPALTDFLIAAALEHRYGAQPALPALAAPYAERAHRAAVEVARSRGRPAGAQ